MATPNTSSRLPRWCRPRYSPASSPHTNDSRQIASTAPASRSIPMLLPRMSVVIQAA